MSSLSETTHLCSLTKFYPGKWFLAICFFYFGFPPRYEFNGIFRALLKRAEMIWKDESQAHVIFPLFAGVPCTTTWSLHFSFGSNFHLLMWVKPNFFQNLIPKTPHYLRCLTLLHPQLVYQGAKVLYERHIRPFLLRHQTRLDQVADGTYSELVS